MSDGQVDVLDLVSISKTFPGQRALAGVDFRVREGEVHALLGHNGSGKSTLIKIMSGFHLPDDGPAAAGTPRYAVAGHPVRFGDAVGVRRAGVRFIHQDIGLVEGLTVLENLRLGTGTYQASTLGPVRWRTERSAAVKRLTDLGLDDIDPGADVSALTAVQRTEVAIARALDDEASIRLLVLDEATAALPAEQVDHLFALVRRLAARGVGIVYVTHRLEEVLALAARVTVLRDGAIVHQAPVADQTRGSLARIIAGSEIAEATPGAAAAEAGAPVLELDGVHGGRELRGATLTLHAGEVLGVAGLEGSGVHEVVRLLEGSVPLTAGEVRVDGVRARRFGARALRRHGVAVLPGERRQKTIPTMTVRENLTISDLAPFWVHGRLRKRAEVRAARSDIARFSIVPAEPERPIELLSGGNAQKVFVARLVRTSPRVLVLEEPTHGVDVGGSADILRFVSQVAEESGTSVLLCSSDTDDLAAACHRVVVLRDGVVTDQLRGEEITRERIVELCYAQS